MPRTVYGNDWSENGWRMIWDTECQWTTVPGTSVSLQIAKGQPLAILRAFAADFNAYVEPLRDADSACWTRENKVGTSNHLSGTGMDLNWNGADGKTFRYGISKERAYPGDKSRKLDELLDFYEDIVFCGGEWGIQDWMHMQLNGNTYGQPRTADFITRKIRPDGFSTYKRGNMPQVSSGALALSKATGLSPSEAEGILPALAAGLVLAECNNTNRLAMALAQWGHESVDFKYTTEIASGDAYDTRTDLGNTPEVDGDGALYKGATWIQITGKHNFRRFSEWAFSKDLVPTPDYFVVRPLELRELKWAGIGAAWYWTVARSDINELSDKRDIELVSRRINGTNRDTGRANGIQDRINRYNRALAVGNDLLLIINGEGDDFLPGLNVDESREVLNYLRWAFAPNSGEFRKQFPHRSMYSPGPETDTVAGRVASAHAFGWDYRVELGARLGQEWAIDLVAQAAAGTLWGVQTEDGTADALRVNQARAILDDLEKNHPEVLKVYLAKKGVAV